MPRVNPRKTPKRTVLGQVLRLKSLSASGREGFVAGLLTGQRRMLARERGRLIVLHRVSRLGRCGQGLASCSSVDREGDHKPQVTSARGGSASTRSRVRRLSGPSRCGGTARKPSPPHPGQAKHREVLTHWLTSISSGNPGALAQIWNWPNRHLSLRAGVVTLQTSPFTCRKAGHSPFLRELIIPLDRSACVALFEIVGSSEVFVSAVRHQLEDDYH